MEHYVKDHIAEFHTSRIKSLRELKLRDVLKSKNPYLFRVKNVIGATEMVTAIVNAHISSNEETIFGNWLEQVAIFVNRHVYGGQKSSTKGIDLEFEKDGIRYLVVIKSGPNWGNAAQQDDLISTFKTALKTLRTSGAKVHTHCVNGCCYGRSYKDAGVYEKYCGEKFWTFISGNAELYKTIIKPLGHMARERNEEFQEQLEASLTLFVVDFAKEFCTSDGKIDWNKLIEFNSGIAAPPRAKIKRRKLKPVDPEEEAAAILEDIP